MLLQYTVLQFIRNQRNSENLFTISFLTFSSVRRVFGNRKLSKVIVTINNNSKLKTHLAMKIPSAQTHISAIYSRKDSGELAVNCI